MIPKVIALSLSISGDLYFKLPLSFSRHRFQD